MNNDLSSGGLSQAYVTLLADTKVHAAEIAILKAQQTKVEDLPELLVAHHHRLAALESSQGVLRKLGWTLLAAFSLFICAEAYKTWIQVKVTPPTIVYPKPPGGPY